MCLQMLRALSHIPGNVATMVTSHTTAAVLGSMAVYKDDESVQSNCLDILAKMATFMPSVLEKVAYYITSFLYVFYIKFKDSVSFYS